jgi:hypothetical protein
LRDRLTEFEAIPANLAAVGLGLPAMAEDFRQQLSIPFPVLVDPEAVTYRLMQIERGSLIDVVGPGRWLPTLKSLSHGYMLRPTDLDMKQLGGAAVVGPDGALRYTFRAKTAEQLPPIDELLAACRHR